jgi:hypothetical protein
MMVHKNVHSIDIIIFLIELSFLFFVIFLTNPIYLIYCGVLLFLSIPALGIIGMLKNANTAHKFAKVILSITILCQIIIILVPLLFVLFSFTFVDERGNLGLYGEITFCISFITIFVGIFVAVVLNFVYAVLVQYTCFLYVLAQILYASAGYYAANYGARMMAYYV